MAIIEKYSSGEGKTDYASAKDVPSGTKKVTRETSYRVASTATESADSGDRDGSGGRGTSSVSSTTEYYYYVDPGKGEPGKVVVSPDAAYTPGESPERVVVKGTAGGISGYHQGVAAVTGQEPPVSGDIPAQERVLTSGRYEGATVRGIAGDVEYQTAVQQNIAQGYVYDVDRQVMERQVSPGVVTTKPLQDIASAESTIGHAIQEGYIVSTEQGLVFAPGTPLAVKEQIRQAVARHGYRITEQDGVLYYSPLKPAASVARAPGVKGGPTSYGLYFYSPHAGAEAKAFMGPVAAPSIGSETIERSTYGWSTQPSYRDITDELLVGGEPLKGRTLEEIYPKPIDMPYVEESALLPLGATPEEAAKKAMIISRQKAYLEATAPKEVLRSWIATEVEPVETKEGYAITVPFHKGASDYVTRYPVLATEGSEWVSFQDVGLALVKHPEYAPLQTLPLIAKFTGPAETAELLWQTGAGEGEGHELLQRTRKGQMKEYIWQTKTLGVPGSMAVFTAPASYWAKEGTFLFADAAYTVMAMTGIAETAVKGYQIASTKGIPVLAKTAVSESVKALGAPSKFGTALAQKGLSKVGYTIPAGASKVLQYGTGLAALGSVAAYKAGWASEQNIVGYAGKGLYEKGEALARYSTLTSKSPEERAGIVSAATLYNIMPYYGLKLYSVQPEGPKQALGEAAYILANIGSVGLMGYGETQRVAQEAGYRSITEAPPEKMPTLLAEAFGATWGELAFFEFMFEAQTIDKAFEGSGIYRGKQQELQRLVAEGKISPEKYQMLWSGIDMPTISADVTGIKPSARAPAIVATADTTIEMKPSEDMLFKLQKGGIEMATDTTYEAKYEADRDAELRKRFDVKATTVRPSMDVRPEPSLRPEFKPAPEFDIRPDYDIRPEADIRPDIKPEPEIDSTKIEPPTEPKVDIEIDLEPKQDTKIDFRPDTTIDIFQPAILGAAFLPGLLAGGRAGGETAKGGRIRVPGKIADLLSISRSAKGTPLEKRPEVPEPPQLIKGDLWGRRTAEGPPVLGRILSIFRR